MSTPAEAPDDGAESRRARPESLKQWARNLHALDIEVASRAGLAVAIPLVVLALLGRLDLAIYASFGAFTSLYGRREVYRTRLRTASTAAVVLVACITAGVLVSQAGSPLVALSIGLLLVVAVGVVLSRTLSLHPPTPIFYVFAFLVCGIVPVPGGNVGVAILIGVASAVLALVITMSGWLLRLGRDVDRITASFKMLKPLPRRADVRPNAWRDPGVWLNIGQLLVGGFLAGLIGSAVGLGHSYWAVVSVIAVVPPVRAAHSITRSIHRTLGTFAGVIVTGLILWGSPPVWLLIIIVALCQFGAEIFVGRHYGTALVVITPLALLMVHLSSPSLHVPDLLLDRAVETAIGALVGMVMVLLARLVRVPAERP
ncbi:Fusaric acid resistance protein-like [Paramicrobacterium humi]|uniref:Fusaric acid resistance protein-like n=1 Tax=Paramicrobacterium humi TaxID=640635 RepID=A0A1H4IY03_9MICO|nr:FUSC family protein [Microbacterium humi]SEB38929.1 Fusaric acid resistance protein-like [Microbacterium humi]